MPPVPSWYQDREAIRAFLLATPFGSGVRNRWRLYPTQANGQPAFVLYRADEAQNAYRAYSVQVVTLDDSQVADVTAFLDPSLVTAFGFPLQLPE
jgi:RNA polymerase sigma-70 factor (ECF subfamily)